jgi:hypothetical protein
MAKARDSCRLELCKYFGTSSDRVRFEWSRADFETTTLRGAHVESHDKRGDLHPGHFCFRCSRPAWASLGPRKRLSTTVFCHIRCWSASNGVCSVQTTSCIISRMWAARPGNRQRESRTGERGLRTTCQMRPPSHAPCHHATRRGCIRGLCTNGMCRPETREARPTGQWPPASP